MLYKKIIKPVLFSVPPDYTHVFVSKIGSLLGKTPLSRKFLGLAFNYNHPALETEVCGIKFKNPVGLAGGFDKDCDLIQTMPHVGFGFMEVGSVTYHSYGGNQRPWSVRAPDNESILVNYGLKNKGAAHAKKKIEQAKKEIPLVINIAKTNNPDIKGLCTVADYMRTFLLLFPLADMVNINISCPNSGDGALLCENEYLLRQLLDALEKEVACAGISKPIFIKIKSEIPDDKLRQIIGLVKAHPSVKGFIISNLAGDRSLLLNSREKYSRCPGGISGLPMRAVSTEMIRKVYRLTGGQYPIIGVGGIFSAEDAYEKILAGASLIELLTGLIYEGPGLVKRINQGLVKLLEKNGYRSVSEAVGRG